MAGAYTLATFGVGKAMPANVSGGAVAPERVTIPVEDTDKNGVEDWRDSFFMEQSTVISTVQPSEYTQPTTQTGKVAISLLEESIRAKHSLLSNRTPQQIASDAVSSLSEESSIKLYDLTDISIMESWTDSDVKTYANAMGQIILSSKNPSGERESEILKDIMLNGRRERYAELQIIMDGYRNYREQTLALPVPKPFVRQHLDLINTYEAMEKDVDAFLQIETDPLLSLTHLQRYPDDIIGLTLALRNFSTSLDPYTNLFTTADAAVVFTIFDPNYTKP